MQPITLFLDSSKSGGIETHVQHLATALHQQAFSVQVIVWKKYQDQAHPLESAMSKHGIPFHYANGQFSELKRLIEKESILHSHGYKANIISKMGHALGLWKAFPTHHNGDIGHGMLKQYVKLDEFSSRWFSPISVSGEIFHRLGDKGLKIKNFVPLSSCSQPTSSIPVNQTESLLLRNGRAPIKVAFVGRISDEKDPEAFCKLADTLLECSPKTALRFYVYGDGSRRDELKKTYPHVAFLGEKVMSHYWQHIDVLCITSKTEGLPLCALEAMSHGIPVISFNIGDLPELIHHEENGWLIPAGNIPSMTKALLKWESFHESRKTTMGAVALQTIKQSYSSETVIPTLVKHYQIA